MMNFNFSQNLAHVAAILWILCWFSFHFVLCSINYNIVSYAGLFLLAQIVTLQSVKKKKLRQYWFYMKEISNTSTFHYSISSMYLQYCQSSIDILFLFVCNSNTCYFWLVIHVSLGGREVKHRDRRSEGCKFKSR